MTFRDRDREDNSSTPRELGVWRADADRPGGHGHPQPDRPGPGFRPRPGCASPRETGIARGLALSLADAPQAGDQVIEAADVHVFVQAEASVVLDNKSLDAQINEDGEVSFTLQSQS